MTTLLNLARGVPEVHHQLTVLKAITDEVTQKTAMVERQREGIDRVAAQVSHLVTLTSDLESAFRRQEEQAGTMTAIDGKLAALHTQHAAVLTRMSEIAATQRQLDEAERDGERALNALRADMQTSTERFEMENRSLDAVSERIASLRGGVKDCEVRLADATVAATGVAETEARVRALAAQVAGVSDDVQRILNERSPTGYTTVLKLLQIMTEKGLVDRDETCRPQIYRARYSQEKTQRQLLQDLLQRAFGGSVKTLVMQALSSRKSSPRELEELERLLDRFEGEKK